MKKHYTEPAIDLVEMEVEQGIALSQVAAQEGTFDLSGAGYEEYNGGAAIW